MRAAGEPGLATRARPGETTTHAERGWRLAELILTRSRRDGLRSGGRLPTERQLAIDPCVPRSSVPHAPPMLHAPGHTSRHAGPGTFLPRPPAARPPGAG